MGFAQVCPSKNAKYAYHIKPKVLINMGFGRVHACYLLFIGREP